jgi:hypothetical protein
MVDLEDTNVWIRIAVSEGVQTGAEENVLSDSSSDGVGEVVFGVAAAGDKKRTQTDGERAIGTCGSAAKLLGVGGTENRNSDWIIKYERLRVVKLVRGATQRYAESRS